MDNDTPLKEENQVHNEAPLSVHIDSYYLGYHVGWTVRREDNKELPLSSVVSTIHKLDELGFTPSWNPDTNKAHKDPDPAWIQKKDIHYEKDPGIPIPGWCTIHETNMSAKEGKYGKFYSHRDGDGWCSGRVKKS